ncbi:MAG: putative sigma-54 modulation protein [Gammaproteobacteria bacterium]|jgi:putative sigma-54 modulation protein
MQIDIQTFHFSITEVLRSYIERQLCTSLSFCDELIQRVDIRLSDIDGPRGGVDKFCRVRVGLSGLPEVVVDDCDVDLYAAIDRAANCAGRTVQRRVTRKRHRARTPVRFVPASIEE